MCDTMVALGAATRSGATLFAKNSDRDANEAQIVEVLPACDHPAGKTVRLTYIEIPQAARTHTVMLSRPYWMWGAEMGANEHGVAIGNEAIRTKIPPEKTPGLIGMDMVRLGLERSTSAREAMTLLCTLIETYGQSGNCGHPQAGPFHYHNSFLIADRTSAFVLETIGKNWICEKVTGTRSISNTLTIGEDFDAMSDGLKALAETVGWEKGSSFNFREIFSNKVLSNLSSGPARWRRTRTCLAQRQGHLTPRDMMRILRDRGRNASGNPNWRPDGLMNGTVCANASFGPSRKFGQTVGSQVSLLTGDPGGDRHFTTATSAPDIGIFKPLSLDPAQVPRQLIPKPTGIYDTASLWWRHEKLHRAVLDDYPARLRSFERARDRIEADIVEQALKSDGHRSCQSAWDKADDAMQIWQREVEATPCRNSGSPAYQFHWRRLAQKAKFSARSPVR